MNAHQRFTDLVAVLATSLIGLPDKPEETAEATARALWWAAAKQPCCLEKAETGALPVLEEEGLAELGRLVEQRLAGVPLAHLTGRQGFMGIELLAGPEVLVARKETEILGRAALQKLRALVHLRGHVTVIDLCTGSGNLAVAMAHHEPQCRVLAADLSPAAVMLARRNVAFHRLEHRVEVREGDLLSPFAVEASHQKVDLIICNPPYISSSKVDTLPAEIASFEPRMAFDGGALGFNILSRLMKEAPQFLKPESWLCFEVGLGQGDYLANAFRKAPQFACVERFPDPAGAIRALAAQTR